ncbi:hypothetical protein DY000_02012808 [Brassica cretica]|uniref:Uncharacterized protein n=1 Tax=Brassica cretica TaxID=69181 RepID=A0ABQ7CY65_BRACR|nr:hypothetical protein DY000_02012808 [Brassica cretica]
MSSSFLGGKDVKKTGELLAVNLVSLNEKALIFSVDDVDPRVYRNSELSTSKYMLKEG